MGETGASALFAYRDGAVTEVKRHRGRESIGFFFGLVTDLAGFDQTKGEEWKIMGLAPYGRRDPELLTLLRGLYTTEGGKLVFAEPGIVRDVADAIWPAALPMRSTRAGPISRAADRMCSRT